MFLTRTLNPRVKEPEEAEGLFSGLSYATPNFFDTTSFPSRKAENTCGKKLPHGMFMQLLHTLAPNNQCLTNVHLAEEGRRLRLFLTFYYSTKNNREKLVISNSGKCSHSLSLIFCLV